jgi:gamma-glutamylcyclotransferase
MPDRSDTLAMTLSYFAYGSNMAAETIARLCPRHRYLGVARLDDYRLAFRRRSVRTGTGVADVIPAPGATVWGTLYLIEDDELSRLDRKEGYDWAYTRTTLPVRLEASGPERAAIVYAVRDKERTDIPPSPRYLSELVAAAHARGLPASYINDLEAVKPSDAAP